jgi:hypothetical protein
MHGTADRTSGGLKKSDLKMKDGRIISKAASKASAGNPWVKAVAKARKQLAKGSASEKKASKEMLVNMIKDSARAWKICVNRAKRHYKISVNTYMVLKGPVLKYAQRMYCAMGF